MEAIAIGESLLRIVAAVLPGVLAATAGTQTDEEAIEAMASTAKRMHVREGDGGTWQADLNARKGRRPTPSDVLTPRLRGDGDDS